MSNKVKKIVEENLNAASLDSTLSLSDRSITSLTQISSDFAGFNHLSELILAHNSIKQLTSSITNLKQLKLLNCFNNELVELPGNLSELQELTNLNLGMNKLHRLPNSFHKLSKLEILDLTYNNFNETVCEQFCEPLSKSLRALYISDNDFHHLPSRVTHLKKLQILCARDNEITVIPPEIENMDSLNELHLQGNLLSLLPPQLPNLFAKKLNILRLERNYFIQPIEKERKKGQKALMDYLRSDLYDILYSREGGDQNAEPSADRKKEREKKRQVTVVQGQ